jgi:hypothetical protein
MFPKKMMFAALVSVLAFQALPAAAGQSGLRGPLEGPQPVQLLSREPGPGGFMSPNLSYVATIPIESPGVSARVVQVGAVRRLYVSSAKGLAVYNVTNPAVPLLMGRLDTHNWENEDVAVSADGKTVLMSDFQGFAYLIVIEVTDLPGGLVALRPVGYNTDNIEELNAGNHTIECVDDACDYAYGSEGKTYDLRDKTQPKRVTDWSAVTGRSGHHVTRDSAGLIWTDTSPIFALDVTDPVTPRIVAQSDRPAMNAAQTEYQHNNMRPFADRYAPRLTQEELADPSLRAGEILLGEGETNFTVECGDGGSGNGPFASYDLRNFDQPDAPDFKPLDVFRPIKGDWADGNPAVQAMGCSGHWFDVAPISTPHKIVTVNAWYEHGTRLFEVSGHTGKITQIGYFQPVVGAASASYWVGDEYIYTVDYQRGIDILHFDSEGLFPTEAQFNASWLAKLNAKDALAEAERYYCRLGASQSR